jgi:hypothetical protein
VKLLEVKPPAERMVVVEMTEGELRTLKELVGWSRYDDAEDHGVTRAQVNSLHSNLTNVVKGIV